MKHILYESHLAKIIGYIGFLAIFVLELIIASARSEVIAQLQAWQVALLAIAAFRGGIAIAENEVFCWIREPFTITAKDATGAGDSVSPKYEHGIMSAIGNCLACPICCLTHVGSILITIYSLLPGFGLLLIYGLGIAGIGELAYASREYLFWNGRRSRESCK